MKFNTEIAYAFLRPNSTDFFLFVASFMFCIHFCTRFSLMPHRPQGERCSAYRTLIELFCCSPAVSVSALQPPLLRALPPAHCYLHQFATSCCISIARMQQCVQHFIHTRTHWHLNMHIHMYVRVYSCWIFVYSCMCTLRGRT